MIEFFGRAGELVFFHAEHVEFFSVDIVLGKVAGDL